MIEEGQLLWEASKERRSSAEITKFINWLKPRGKHFEGYEDLWAWSISDIEGFWMAVWDYFELIADNKIEAIVTNDPMPRTRWFTGTRLNYAEHVLRHEFSGDPKRDMLRHGSELRDLTTMSWSEVAGSVRKMATKMRELGLGKGDRVVAYMPNIPEAVIAMLATTAIGAVWSSAAPEFGAQTVIDRFGQIEPKLVFAVSGYRYGGKDFDRSNDLEKIIAALPTAKHVVMLDYHPQNCKKPRFDGETLRFEDMLAGLDIKVNDFTFERVESDHPLWILFSSGTTGLPKPIVHGHHGIVLEHYKSAAFHFELGKDDALFFYSTTGWMVWNTLMWGPLMNGVAVLYDGHPSYPDARLLWKIADASGAAVLGVNPTLMQIVRNQGIGPSDEFSFEKLKTVLLVGSPAMPEAFEWIYDAVKSDIWVTSQSGGTEFCSGILAGSVLLPSRAGEIQACGLATDAVAFNEDGVAISDEVGELVVLKPMPSMPLYFWRDKDYKRYSASYFGVFPEVWTHGDRVKFNGHGGCFVLGRSDATLNRFGVRIGSAEIYRTTETFNEFADSLIVCIEDGKGGYYMPLFVKMVEGLELTEGLIAEVRLRLKTERSPRHVPDEIRAVPDIPVTLTGKKMEIPVRRILLGEPIEKVASRDATRNPSALEWFVNFANQRKQNTKNIRL
jgi:acetoacetyl-CoA synthetase